jgi:hypothetical protein
LNGFRPKTIQAKLFLGEFVLHIVCQVSLSIQTYGKHNGKYSIPIVPFQDHFRKRQVDILGQAGVEIRFVRDGNNQQRITKGENSQWIKK